MLCGLLSSNEHDGDFPYSSDILPSVEKFTMLSVVGCAGMRSLKCMISLLVNVSSY